MSLPKDDSSGDFPDDLALVEGVLARDPQRLDEFLERMGCVRRMLVYRNRVHGSPLNAEELEDLVQDTLFAVWRKLDEYRGAAPLEAWIYRFTYLQTLAHLRKRERRPDALEVLPETEIRDEQPPDEEVSRAVHGALERLGRPCSQIIAMKLLEGLTFRAIGGKLDMPTNTVKTRYYRGLRRMRDMLRGLEEEVLGG